MDDKAHTQDKMSERWSETEEAYIRPTSRWALIAATALGLLFWWGVFKFVFG